MLAARYSKDKRISKQHYYNISFPKNFCTRFGLGKGSLFLWSVVKDQPLTFKLTQVVVDNNNEGGNV